jgi:hypothetical protein
MSSLAGHLGRVSGIAVWITALQPQVAMAVDAQKHADIQTLMRVTGMLANMNRMLEIFLPKMIDNFKKINPSIPEATWAELARLGADEFKKSVPELEEPVTAIFDENFTGQEIKQLIVFYETPLGHKVLTQMPVLMQQSATLGQKWGERVGARVAERIRAAAKQKATISDVLTASTPRQLQLALRDSRSTAFLEGDRLLVETATGLIWHHAEPGEPFAQKGFAAGTRFRGEALGVATQCRSREPWNGGDLDCMSDEPALETVAADFGMELAGEGMTSESKGLVRTNLGRCEEVGPFRQVEGVAVPMEDRHPGEMP